MGVRVLELGPGRNPGWNHGREAWKEPFMDRDHLHVVKETVPDRCSSQERTALWRLVGEMDGCISELSDECPWKWALLGIRRHLAASVDELLPREVGNAAGA